MKKRLVLTVAALLVLCFAYGLGYRSGNSRARSVVHFAVEKDASDSGSHQSSVRKSGSDPYYNTVNSIPGKASQE